jgi:hypothetical protein
LIGLVNALAVVFAFLENACLSGRTEFFEILPLS